MASRKPVSPHPLTPPADGLAMHGIAAIDGDGQDELPDVDRIKLQLGGLADGESRVNVYRVAPGQKDVFLFEQDPSEFSMAAIQSTYGAGRYRLRVYGSDSATGRARLQVNQQFELGEPLRRPVVASDDASSSNLSRALALLVDEVRQMRHVPAPVPVDPMANMKAMIDMAVLFKGLMPAAAPAAPALDPLAMIKMMREMKDFGAELAGTSPPPKEESEWSGLAQAAGALISAMKPPAAPVEVDPRQSISYGGEISPSSVTGQPGEGGDVGMMMKLAVGQLLGAAIAGRPHNEVADQVMAVASDEVILGVLEADNWFEGVLHAAPQAAAHRAYFESLRSVILSRYPPDQGGVPGSKSDAVVSLHQSAA